MANVSEQPTLGACPEYEARLEDYIGGELSSQDFIDVKRHLESCLRCQPALEAALEGGAMLREYAFEAGLAHAASPAFARTLMARIRISRDDQASESESFWQSLVHFGWRFAATAAVVVVFLAGIGAVRGRSPQPNVAGIRPTTMRDMLAVEDAAPPANRDETLVMMAGMSNER